VDVTEHVTHAQVSPVFFQEKRRKLLGQPDAKREAHEKYLRCSEFGVSEPSSATHVLGLPSAEAWQWVGTHILGVVVAVRHFSCI
jgi:hypothetical protein